VPHDALPVTEQIAPLLLGLPVAADLPANDISRVVEGLGAAIMGRP
jgi:hypothetical protein